ncbi:hypothetical protein HDV05_008742 [Chytridiales sp. JEL 0842]|nr:hypothetical protein HDV05_008742 [Chytridiales sp. JEL 0842]
MLTLILPILVALTTTSRSTLALPTCVTPPATNATSRTAYSFLVIGDWGYPTSEVARRKVMSKVATQMNNWAGENDARLVFTTGDNFYYRGLTSVDDPRWKSDWMDVYRNSTELPHLSQLEWRAVVGNHDYCDGGVEVQLDYTSKNQGWRMDDLFYKSSATFANQSISFLHLDTNLLAYSIETKDWLLRDCPGMRSTFLRFQNSTARGEWTADGHLKRIKGMLEESVNDADWVFGFGHHPIGGAFCGAEGQLGEIKSLFDSFGASGYFNGHVHGFDYNFKDGMVHVTSGAGGDNTGRGCVGSGMYQGERVGGFVGVTLYEDGQVQLRFVDENGKVLFEDWQTKRKVRRS